MPSHKILLCGFALVVVAADVKAQSPGTLQNPSSFATMTDAKMRSRALFQEAAKVIMSPRCMNCHPADNVPTQGDDQHPHMPPVTRGPDGAGVAGNTCRACHNEANYALHEGASYRSIPGHPRWAVAPIEMAWQGLSPGQICQRILDPAHNGGRTVELLLEHLAKDDLVGWGWNPGLGRKPVPGTQQQFGDLIKAWIDSGAECP